MKTTSILKAVAALVLCTAGGRAEDMPPAVTIQIFSDFQCPYCRMFAPAAREVESKGIEGIQIRVEFKNFPLSFHPFAQLAAQAAAAPGNKANSGRYTTCCSQIRTPWDGMTCSNMAPPLSSTWRDSRTTSTATVSKN